MPLAMEVFELRFGTNC